MNKFKVHTANIDRMEVVYQLNTETHILEVGGEVEIENINDINDHFYVEFLVEVQRYKQKLRMKPTILKQEEYDDIDWKDVKDQLVFQLMYRGVADVYMFVDND